MVSAPESHPFKEHLTSLPKPGGGQYGKFYSLTSLKDPRIGNFVCVLVDGFSFSVRVVFVLMITFLCMFNR